jgi:hypothetical protein
LLLLLLLLVLLLLLWLLRKTPKKDSHRRLPKSCGVVAKMHAKKLSQMRPEWYPK